MPKNLTPNHFEMSHMFVEGQRSQFRFKKCVLDSFMSGMLVPVGDPIPVFPGQKYALKLHGSVQSGTLTIPPLDGMYIDVVSIWVPSRILWTHHPQFLGENDTTAWTQSTAYSYPSMPLTNLNDSLYNKLSSPGNVADASVTAGNLFLTPHFGLYYNVNLNAASAPSANVEINVLPYRGYYACWNHYFRDENYQRPVLWSKTDVGTSGEFGYFLRDYVTKSGTTPVKVTTTIGRSLGQDALYYYAALMPVNKFHDAYTSVLPEAQFGNSVTLNLGETAPLIGLSSVYNVGSNAIMFGAGTGALGVSNGQLYAGGTAPGSGSQIFSTNLVADLSNATASNINQLRASVMTQRFLEALARGGRRVDEYYEAIYNVKNTNAKFDYPELISRSRYLLGVNQVVATADSSGSGWSSHLGDRGAYSLTTLRDVPVCERDFSEFGYLYVFICVRSNNRYSQFIPEHFTRKYLLDEYNPFFDHIGDVAVPNHLVNVLASTTGNFGYQEAWWSIRTQMNMANSAMNKSYGSLAYWTLGETFDSSLVTCTPEYLTYDPGLLNDVFVNTYDTYPQFIIDACIEGTCAGRISQHSIPGIVGRI